MIFWLPVFTLWRRELIRFWREKARVVGFVAPPLLFWFVMGSGFGNLGFYFPGALTLTVMFSAVFSNMSLIEDRREGFLLSLLVSPASRAAMVLGKVLGSGTLAWLQGLFVLLFLPLTGIPISLTAVLAVSGALLLIALTFTVLGFLLAWRTDSAQGFHAILNLLLVPMWMVSGALFSITSAHGWLQWVMRFNPLTYANAALVGLLDRSIHPELPTVSSSLLLITACAIILFIAAVAQARRSRS